MLTANDLGTTQLHIEALLKVRNGLASGEYVHVNVNGDPPEAGHRGFDMNCDMNGCGTVACIGGWMAAELGMGKGEAQAFVHNNDTFHDLFFPGQIKTWEQITPEMAVEAIDSFLEHGDPDWQRIAERHDLDVH